MDVFRKSEIRKTKLRNLNVYFIELCNFLVPEKRLPESDLHSKTRLRFSYGDLASLAYLICRLHAQRRSLFSPQQIIRWLDDWQDQKGCRRCHQCAQKGFGKGRKGQNVSG